MWKLEVRFYGKISETREKKIYCGSSFKILYLATKIMYLATTILYLAIVFNYESHQLRNVI